jgi:outer membrane protein TolC
MPKLAKHVAKLVAISVATTAAGCASLFTPLSDADIGEMSGQLIETLAAAPEPPSQPLTLDEAVRRAMLYNQSVRAKELEAALAMAQVRAQSAEMLPRLAAEIDLNWRDRPSLTRSNATQTYSTSSDRSGVARDITLSWNILDFGLSLLRTSQGMDKAYQQFAEAIRLRSRIREETRSAFWNAVALEQLERGMAQLERETRVSLQLARNAANDNKLEPMAAINLQREILNLQRELNQVLLALAGSRDQLRQSIGLPLLSNLKLASKRRVAQVAVLETTASEDIVTALERRPEVQHIMYEMRITEREATAAVLKVLPGVSFDTKRSADSNSFLLHPHWISWGARIAGDLITAVNLPNELDAIEAKQDANRQNALATAALVVMQVHVSRARLAVQARASRDAELFADVQRQLLRQARAAVATGKVGADVVIREKLATLLAETRAIVAYAAWHAAAAAYDTATGREAGSPLQVDENSRS